MCICICTYMSVHRGHYSPGTRLPFLLPAKDWDTPSPRKDIKISLLVVTNFSLSTFALKIYSSMFTNIQIYKHHTIHFNLTTGLRRMSVLVYILLNTLFHIIVSHCDRDGPVFGHDQKSQTKTVRKWYESGY